MNDQTFNSESIELTSAELEAVHGGIADIIAADDPTFIPADGPQDKPAPAGRRLTPKQRAALNKWLAHIR